MDFEVEGTDLVHELELDVHGDSWSDWSDVWAHGLWWYDWNDLLSPVAGIDRGARSIQLAPRAPQVGAAEADAEEEEALADLGGSFVKESPSQPPVGVRGPSPRPTPSPSPSKRARAPRSGTPVHEPICPSA